jgi:hypothetical protein
VPCHGQRGLCVRPVKFRRGLGPVAADGSFLIIESGSYAVNAVTLSAPPFLFFEAVAEAAVAVSPRRPRSAVERGVRHDSVRLTGGRWTWRYDLFGERPAWPTSRGWDDVSAISAPVMLVRGGDSGLVTDDDVAQFREPDAGARCCGGAGGRARGRSDQLLALARLIEEFGFGWARGESSGTGRGSGHRVRPALRSARYLVSRRCGVAGTLRGRARGRLDLVT